MSSNHTFQVWGHAMSDHDKVGLLALAEIVGSNDLIDRVTLNFSGLNALQRFTAWSTEEVEAFVRRALRLPDNYPIGGMSGIDFDFDDAIDAVRGIHRDQETGLPL